MSDLVKNRTRNLGLIVQFENKIAHLARDLTEAIDELRRQQALDSDAISECESDLENQAEETKEDLRVWLLDSLASSFADSGNQIPSKVYEEIVASFLIDKIRRNMGYYEAVRRAETEVYSVNNSLGDKAIEIDSTFIIRNLSYIDDIYMYRHLCVAFGLEPKDTDRIINHMIDKEFGRSKE